MDQEQKDILKSKILKRNELFKLNNSRFRRLMKDPFRTFCFYVLAVISRIKPFKITAKTLWGEKMTYYLAEGQAIFYYGFFEANLTNFFINFFKEGDTFIDIGAHVGYYSVLVSSLVGEKGEVHSFEPTPRTFESLKENTSNKNNVTVNNTAVLDEKKVIKFIDYGPKFSAFNSFHHRTAKGLQHITKNGKEIVVPTIVLDEYIFSKEIIPSVIKIDAEGAESLILKGMEKTLNELRPMVSIEVAGDDEWKENCKESVGILLNKKYQMFECTLDGKLKKHELQEKYSYDNLIFVPKEKLALVEKLIVE